jgi:hypothetical protein
MPIARVGVRIFPGRGHASRFFDFIATLGWTGRYLARVRGPCGSAGGV